ncbi:MAG: hypothetical protein O2781_03015 [Bacteroidetes bacterium]|nr:hypothetical protein [Bacteroidota bacterium]
MKKLFLLVVTFLTVNVVLNASFPVVENHISIEEPCDNIILKNGEEISAKIFEITPDLIKYKKCDNLDGPLISIYKDDVFMLRYHDGSKDLFNDEVIENKNANKNSEVPLAGILSLSFSLFAFLVPLPLLFGVLLAGAGFISGLGSLDEKYWGLSLAGVIIGLIDLIVFYYVFISI